MSRLRLERGIYRGGSSIDDRGVVSRLVSTDGLDEDKFEELRAAQGFGKRDNHRSSAHTQPDDEEEQRLPTAPQELKSSEEATTAKPRAAPNALPPIERTGRPDQVLPSPRAL